jgi:ribose 5-phosphate isomerase B
MRLVIGSDKSGFVLKEAIKKHLLEKGYELSDIGTQNMDNGVPFFDVAPKAAKLIQSKEYERAILICGTGMGMAIVANKFQGVYAAVCESVYAAQKSRAINNANVLTMGGWVVGEIMAIDMVDTFLKTEFTEGLEEWRQEFLKKAIVKVDEIEKEIY